MGFFDRFRKGSSESQESIDEPIDEGTPAVVAVARRGMSTPPADYVEAVLRADVPAALEPNVIRVALSQPHWPASADLMDSNVGSIVRALARSHGFQPVRSTYIETRGPDGAEVILVSIWAPEPEPEPTG